jgi:type I restriction enzyme S subunit
VNVASPWTRRAPEAWQRTLLGHVVDIRSGATPSKDEGSYWGGSIPWVSPKDMKVLRIADAEDHVSDAALQNSALKLLPVGSVLMVTRGMILDHTVPIALTTERVTINQDMKALLPRPGTESRYLTWLLVGLNPALLARVEEAAHGTKALRTAQWTKLPIALPSTPSQRRIADFLDRKTAVIDELIAKKERLVALLAEKRQALITQLVTKGLDPSAPMKGSNIEWLTDVPTHWRILRIRFLFGERVMPPMENDEIVTAFRDGQVTLRSLRRNDGFMLAEKEVGYQHVCAGDLVVHSMDAFAGAIGVAEASGKCTPEYVVLTPVTRDVACNAYFAALLRVMAQRGFISVTCPSVRERAPRLRFFALRDMSLPVPPASEQAEIGARLAAIAPNFTHLIATLRTSVDRLREYRQALITAAVTGELDIGDARAVAVHEERVAEAT